MYTGICDILTDYMLSINYYIEQNDDMLHVVTIISTVRTVNSLLLIVSCGRVLSTFDN